MSRPRRSARTYIYQAVVRADRSDQDAPEQASIARNGLRQVLAEALQSTGDQVVNAKTVLPWALATLGAPGFLIALLVPIRESGSMLPQAALAPVLQRSSDRKSFWLWGASGQALATAGMALAIATLSGWVAGVAVVGCLAIFALSRSLNSLAGKDVLGRTVPKGERGQITGLTTVLSGAVAITLGVALRVIGDDFSTGLLAGLLAVAALLWVGALVVFSGIRDPGSDVPPDPAEGPGWVAQSWELMRSDAHFRTFVIARALLLVSALSPPFVVSIAAQRADHGLAGLGPFVIAQGVAALIGGRLAGRLADRSSQGLMVWASVAASLTIAAFLLLDALSAVGGSEWLPPATFLLLALTHVGIRVARKTYVVDMAGEEKRTVYVAVSNTAMGVLLLIVGAISGALSLLGPGVALAFLAVLGLIGSLASRRLPDVSIGKTTH
ncbi:MAG: MFS transporter [Ornithinimicrobium sp.]|uniref:MFS transporter n=1 Tax=Ornithinimicrobium sp. TaxID=1977084 RepID=UPI0026DEBD78|nr:MFS transporter [Ornithinimicrobium sp.]MDO5740916.1 MFS transporter [Ornithinimicrobium sp.]